MMFYILFATALAEHSIDQTIDFVQSDSDFKLYDDRYKINGNDKCSDFKHGNLNVFYGKFRLRAVAAAWLAALAAAHTCRGVRVDGAWPRRPHPAALGGARAAWSAGLGSSWAGGAARAGQAAQRSASALGSPDIETAERRWIVWWGRGSDAPLPCGPNGGSRVPAKPSRFEH